MTPPTDIVRAVRTHTGLGAATVLLACAPLLLAGQTVEGTQGMPLSFAATVDLGQDVGQNPGSLFQARDAAGKVVVGAGYLGAFNTDARSDRFALHVFVKPPGADVQDTVEPLPRANDDAGVYFYPQDGKLFARSRSGRDTGLRVWDPASETWLPDDGTDELGLRIGGRVLRVGERDISYDGRIILSLPPGSGRIAESYVANGVIVYRRVDTDADPFVNEIVAQPWDPGAKGEVDVSRAVALPIQFPTEFLYGRGQLRDETLVTTNCGGVHVFDGTAWRSLNQPDIGADGTLQSSFQVYTVINYHDALLLGQYPTGEVFRYDGGELELQQGWPPVMPGVSTAAREAQSTAIYAGDLYVGVWPWAEVWRYDGKVWQLARRMFTHPSITDAATHPYEEEATALGHVLNRWGQRVTGLAPLGDALFIATSAKGTDPYLQEYDFLSDEQASEYGAIYRLRRPGHLSAQTQWKNGPTQLEIAITSDAITVLQDGRQIGSVELPAGFTDGLAIDEVDWGKGIYGPFRGEIVETAVRHP